MNDDREEHRMRLLVEQARQAALGLEAEFGESVGVVLVAFGESGAMMATGDDPEVALAVLEQVAAHARRALGLERTDPPRPRGPARRLDS